MAGRCVCCQHFCTGTGSEWCDVSDAGRRAATIHSSVQQAAALVPDYGARCPGGSCFWLLPCACGLHHSKRLSACGSATFRIIHSASGRELIGRGVFYGLHMTVGMAVEANHNNRGFGPGSLLFLLR